jgi:hypothetical protein
MDRRGVLRALASLATTATLVACGSSDAASPDPLSTLGDVGQLPGTIAGAATVPSTAPSDTVERGSETTDRPDPPDSDPGTEPVNDGRRTIGRLVAGNRVIVIGDSILASISNRYGNQLCDALVPKGWAVEVDAEVGRFIRFGREVLEEQRDEDWDAAVVMLGNNYDGNPQAFADELALLLDELEPLPVLLRRPATASISPPSRPVWCWFRSRCSASSPGGRSPVCAAGSVPGCCWRQVLRWCSPRSCSSPSPTHAWSNRSLPWAFSASASVRSRRRCRPSFSR